MLEGTPQVVYDITVLMTKILASGHKYWTQRMVKQYIYIIYHMQDASTAWLL